MITSVEYYNFQNMGVADDIMVSNFSNTEEKMTEVAVRKYSTKYVFLKSLKNSEESTCSRASFL